MEDIINERNDLIQQLIILNGEGEKIQNHIIELGDQNKAINKEIEEIRPLLKEISKEGKKLKSFPLETIQLLQNAIQKQKKLVNNINTELNKDSLQPLQDEVKNIKSMLVQMLEELKEGEEEGGEGEDGEGEEEGGEGEEEDGEEGEGEKISSLPKNWRKYKTKNGRIYYWNTKTHKTQWALPKKGGSSSNTKSRFTRKKHKGGYQYSKAKKGKKPSTRRKNTRPRKYKKSNTTTLYS